MVFSARACANFRCQHVFITGGTDAPHADAGLGVPLAVQSCGPPRKCHPPPPGRKAPRKDGLSSRGLRGPRWAPVSARVSFILRWLFLPVILYGIVGRLQLLFLLWLAYNQCEERPADISGLLCFQNCSPALVSVGFSTLWFVLRGGRGTPPLCLVSHQGPSCRGTPCPLSPPTCHSDAGCLSSPC